MNREPRARILYVEDDPSSARLVQRILEAEGFDVRIATDGIAALEAARQLRPDLILMDINISGLDGYEVTTRLRALEELQDVPIIAVTAATLKGDRERALIAGCDGYIPKPIDVDRFPQQVEAFLGGLRERIESPQEKADYLVEYSRRLVERLEEKIRELEKAHAELQHLDKMKTDFVILAGHELRTPLTAIYGYVQILLAMPDIPGSLEEEGSPRYLLNQVVQATRRLTQVVDDILNVFLIEANKLELSVGPVPLHSLIQNVVRNIRNMGPERQLTFEFEGLETLPPIMGDSQRLFQALWHVVSNAVKYTPDGGTRHQQVEQGVAFEGRNGSDHQRNADRYKESRQSELDGCREPLNDSLKDRLPGSNRPPKVAMHRPAQPGGILNGQRLVKAQRPANLGQRLRVTLLAGIDQHRVAWRQADQHEDNNRHQQCDRHH